jgi:hypothetical protein
MWASVISGADGAFRTGSIRLLLSLNPELLDKRVEQPMPCERFAAMEPILTAVSISAGIDLLLTA